MSILQTSMVNLWLCSDRCVVLTYGSLGNEAPAVSIHALHSLDLKDPSHDDARVSVQILHVWSSSS